MCTEFLERIRNCNIKGCLPVIRDTTPLRRSPESLEEEVENFEIQEHMSEAQINPEYDGVEDGIEVEDTEEDGCLSYTYSGESEDLIRIIPLPFARRNASNRLAGSSNVLNGFDYGTYIMINESSSRRAGDSRNPDMIAGDSGLDHNFRVSR